MLPAPLPCILGPGAFWSLLALFHLILEAKYRLLKNEHLRAAAELKSLRSHAGGGRRPGSGGVPWSHDALGDDEETSGEDEQASDHDEG